MNLLNKIETAIKEAAEAVEIVGDVLIVQRLPKPEIKTQGGLVLSAGQQRQVTAFNSNQPEFVKVLAVGKGYYNEDTGADVPLDIKPGYVIEVGKNSVNWFSSFGAIIDNLEAGVGVGLTRDAEARIRFKSEESYNKFMEHFLK